METTELEIEVLVRQFQAGSVFQKCGEAKNLALFEKNWGQSKLKLNVGKKMGTVGWGMKSAGL